MHNIFYLILAGYSAHECRSILLEHRAISKTIFAPKQIWAVSRYLLTVLTCAISKVNQVDRDIKCCREALAAFDNALRGILLPRILLPYDVLWAVQRSPLPVGLRSSVRLTRHMITIGFMPNFSLV